MCFMTPTVRYILAADSPSGSYGLLVAAWFPQENPALARKPKSNDCGSTASAWMWTLVHGTYYEYRYVLFFCHRLEHSMQLMV